MVDQKVGFNLTGSVSHKLDEYLQKNSDEQGERFVMVHPMYLEMQMRSPMGTPSRIEGYELKVYDWTKESGQQLTAKQVYKEHVSKSIPCVFKKSMADVPLVQELTSFGSNQGAIDEVLKTKFSTNHNKVVQFIS